MKTSVAPNHVDLVYRKIGDTHVFASKGIRGLVHVGHTDLMTAIREVIAALNVHVKKTYGVDARYVCNESIEDVGIPSVNTKLYRLDRENHACH